jgi:hypothetical protein
MAAPIVTAPGPLSPGPLAMIGVRYVVLFKEADWRAQEPRLLGLTPVLDTSDLRLYRTGPARVPTFPTAPAAVVIPADLVTLGVLVVAVLRRRSSVARPPPLDILRTSKGGR